MADTITENVARVPLDPRTNRARVTSGMKGSCIGSHSFTIEDGCTRCLVEDHPDGSCPDCHGEGVVLRELVVPWNTAKDIYQDMVTAAVNDNALADQGAARAAAADGERQQGTDTITEAQLAAFERHRAGGERLGVEGWRPSRSDFQCGWYAGLAWLLNQQRGLLHLTDDPRRGGWCIALTPHGGSVTQVHLAGPYRSKQAAQERLDALQLNLSQAAGPQVLLALDEFGAG